MKKKPRKIELSQRWREGSERTRRMLQDRLDFHERLREQRREAREDEKPSARE